MIDWLLDPAHWSGPNGIPIRLLEQSRSRASALLIAAADRPPVGLVDRPHRPGATLAVNLANIGRAIPSLAAIGIIAPITQAFDPELGLQGLPDPLRDDHPGASRRSS